MKQTKNIENMKATNKEYATIGGRIEEYKEIALADGLRTARKEIQKVYEEETSYVYEGLKVYMKFGFDTYYTNKI